MEELLFWLLSIPPMLSSARALNYYIDYSFCVEWSYVLTFFDLQNFDPNGPAVGWLSSRSLEGAQPRQEEHFHAQPTAVAGQPPSPSAATLTL